MGNPSDNQNHQITELCPEKKSFNGIDLIKFICTFLVCIIHIAPFSPTVFGFAEPLNFILQKYICRLAVPFYFVSSGFFLFRKLNLECIDKNAVKDYCFRILRLFGMWSILLLASPNGHLWYLKALVFAVALLSLILYRKVKLSHILLLAIPLYLIGMLGDSYYGLVEPLKSFSVVEFIIEKYRHNFSTTRNGLFMGFIFVFIGALFAHKKISMKTKTAFLGFAVSISLMLIEVILLNRYSIPRTTNMYFFLVPATVFFFGIALNINLKDRKIYKKLRTIGMLIYYLHLLVNSLTGQVFVLIKEHTGIDLSVYSFVTTVIIVTALAALIESLSRKEKFKWLQWLYC